MRQQVPGLAFIRVAIAAAAIGLTALSCESPFAPKANTAIGLRVWAEVTPTTLSLRDSTATLRIRVHVENPAAESLRIVSGGPPYGFTPDPARSQGLEESFRIASSTDSLQAGPGTDYWGHAVYVFAPHGGEFTEATISLREWRMGGWPLAPGPMRVRSYFNGREGSSAGFTFTP